MLPAKIPGTNVVKSTVKASMFGKYISATIYPCRNFFIYIKFYYAGSTVI